MVNPYIIAAMVGACASLVGASIRAITTLAVAKRQFNASLVQRTEENG